MIRMTTEEEPELALMILPHEACHFYAARILRVKIHKLVLKTVGTNPYVTIETPSTLKALIIALAPCFLQWLVGWLLIKDVYVRIWWLKLFIRYELPLWAYSFLDEVRTILDSPLICPKKT